ncbi:MAG: hypothetical protein JWM16_2712, partial [Verrucomicrobiales bacterium]|nr:hypothetical protein [Verrucomicrobiales bacterium]
IDPMHPQNGLHLLLVRGGMPLLPPELIVAKVQGDAPKPSGELRITSEGCPLLKHAGKSLLQQVLRRVEIPCHPDAQRPNAFLPAFHQDIKCLMVILRLDPPHGLLIRYGEERDQPCYHIFCHAPANFINRPVVIFYIVIR